MINPKELIVRLKEKFDNDSRVLAFILVGSQARETVYTANKYSDMEAYVITKDENIEKFEQNLPELVRKMGTVLFSFKHQVGFVTVYDDLFRLELPVIKESGMEGLFNRPKAQVVKVLIDRTNGKLEEILEKRPDNIDYSSEFKDKVINFWHWQIIAVQYFKKGETYNTRAVLNIHTSALIKLFELLNDPLVLLLENNKRIEQFLTKEQLTQLQEIAPAYNKQQIESL
ncbi:hypothetical protein A2627_04400 [Candidatus Woesebacteria bacterium RIFCSPHIGHO2_01_FULL_39_28]|uniref:Uncharacterized protein n=1 Tax=Candidatus Woesebacteria bacterium RIFCSPHIGHO2_01_FULL_39_28 TaxID=1802496 RepID=A0A1F7YEE4_9BACT|nr:MAG: hypothetical protein A2627_04400 [Candidatus Woesebacteria bacterium RIFCSPHIGHO2_01_FULL_39_28]OGM57769.1 MAG: hypothetical protein A3A50_05660 [Candidatus Woesebacteria bacterium RIFCSPLOWO2_01_FULL_38_20]